jgi:peptidoglycan/xylan/chitin deacetylase (PgdA/CDA1 family)
MTLRLRLRARLASAAGALRVADAVLTAARIRRPAPFLTVLNYHRVDAPQAAEEMDEGALDATPESFDRQLRILRRHFTPISLADLLSHLEGDPLPPNPALVTFDDGYRDNVRNALPILQSHGVRAAFFIATKYVGERRLFWWDRLSWIVKHGRRRRFSLALPEPVELDIDVGTAKVERRLQDIVKGRAGLDLEAFLGSLAQSADAPWSDAIEAELVERHVMTWDDVRHLRQAGMDIGSHTRTHRVLQTVPTSELADELMGSRTQIEAQLEEPIVTIAYPVGASVARVPSIRAALVAAGYRLGFSYCTGRQDLRALDALDVHRFAVDRDTTDPVFLAQLAMPWLIPTGPFPPSPAPESSAAPPRPATSPPD